MNEEASFEDWFNTGVHVIDGVARGFIIMVVPLVVMGIAIGLAIRIMTVPVKKIGGI